MNDGSSIMLIRHAEKPEEGELAVNRRGHPDAQSLSVTGWMRAGALVRFFLAPDGRGAEPHIVRPQHLVAARATDARPSTRPRDTLQPLAAALGLPIDETLAADDPLPEVAAHLRELPGPVLVCWRHDTLPALADELLQRAQAPTRWPEACYDMVWVIEQQRFSPTLAQVPQRLLPGDATQAIRRRVPARH
jgi:hypothetical protein